MNASKREADFNIVPINVTEDLPIAVYDPMEMSIDLFHIHELVVLNCFSKEEGLTWIPSWFAVLSFKRSLRCGKVDDLLEESDTQVTMLDNGVLRPRLLMYFPKIATAAPGIIVTDHGYSRQFQEVTVRLFITLSSQWRHSTTWKSAEAWKIWTAVYYVSLCSNSIRLDLVIQKTLLKKKTWIKSILIPTK